MPFEVGLPGEPEDVFSTMSPSEGLKMLVSTMMTGHDDGNHTDGPIEMATWDVSRAYFYGEARRWMHTNLLERYEQKGKLAGLCRCMYGTRDTASIWDEGWNCVLCNLCSQDGNLKGLCHGDDFCVVARRKQLQIFGNVLE